MALVGADPTQPAPAELEIFQVTLAAKMHTKIHDVLRKSESTLDFQGIFAGLGIFSSDFGLKFNGNLTEIETCKKSLGKSEETFPAGKFLCDSIFRESLRETTFHFLQGLSLMGI